MPASHAPWTLDHVERLIAERYEHTPRYELVDGELLVTPAPTRRHQHIAGELFVLLRDFAIRHDLGDTYFAPLGVYVAPESYLEPDILVVPKAPGGIPGDERITSLLLAAEVLSPGSKRYDRVAKRRFLHRLGVPHYWTIDGDARTFELWTPERDTPDIVRTAFTWRPRGTDAALTIDVALFFAAIP